MNVISELKSRVSSLLARISRGVTEESGEKINHEIEKIGLLVNELETHGEERRSPYRQCQTTSETGVQCYTRDEQPKNETDDYSWFFDGNTRDRDTAERNKKAEEVLTRLVEGFALTSFDNVGFRDGYSNTIKPADGDASPVPARSLALAESWSADFLEKINILRIEDHTVEVDSINTGSIASTGGMRHEKTRDPSEISKRIYQLEQVNSDISISYSTLSGVCSSNKENEFIARTLEAVERRKLLDLILVGFNGTHHAELSDPYTYKNREDCGRGWLSAWRDEAPTQVVSGLSVCESDQYGRIVKAGDYANIDALVIDTYQTMIDEVFWPDLVALCSHDLLHRKHQPLINNLSASGTPNMETLVHQEVYKNPQLGGIPAVVVPFIPDNVVLVTSLSNLSYYWQNGSWRKNIFHEPRFNRISFYDSWRACYAVENYQAGCVIDGIILPENAEGLPGRPA
ncbi:TPA: P2 family phage major capsid protein [Escherichia coli]|nr:P2 family phage major capsid protein [Escherichia coli O146]